MESGVSLRGQSSFREPCFCSSNNCGGVLRNVKTVRKHYKADAAAACAKISPPTTESHNTLNIATSCPYYPELYKKHVAAKTPLYEGAEITKLDHIFIEFRKFSSHPFHTKEAVTESFKCDRDLKLPKPNESCKSFEDARSTIKDFLVPLIKYQSCPNDCVVYKGNQLKDARKCPKCGANRYDSSGSPRKVFTYMPITPRITRIYQDTELAKIVQFHATREEDGVLRDLWDTERWKGWYRKGGEFDGDNSGICLNFCSDGVNPYKAMHLVYSMWPLMITVMNFPIALRKSFAGIILLGIVPGNGRKEPDVDAYIEIIIDELLALSNCHMHYPFHMKAPLAVKVKLLQYVLDFPAISKIMHLPSAQGIQACPWCEVTGQYAKKFHKTVFLQNRRYLCKEHCLRKSPSYSEREERGPPGVKSHAEITELREKYGKLKNDNQRKKFTKEHGVKGQYPIQKLPYHQFQDDYQPDGMHTLTDVIQNIVGILIGEQDSEKLRAGEQELLPFLNIDDEKVEPLTPENKAVGNQRCHSLNFPKSCSGFKGNVFEKPKIALKNTHGWTEYTASGIWIYLLRGALSTRKRRSLYFFFSVMRRMYQKSFNQDDIPQLVEQTNVALALLERDFSIWLGNITTHLLRHVSQKIADNGPLYASWMFPYERLNSWMSRRALNRNKTEECIMATYQIFDWVMASQLMGQFEHLSIYDDSISDVTNRIIQRGSILDLNKCADVKGRVCSLTERQAMTLSVSTSTKCLTYKQLDYLRILADDVTYRTGDIVYSESKGLFGVIRQLITVKGQSLADLELYQQHTLDLETNIPNTLDTLSEVMVLVTLEDLSDPLVTAVENNYIWFISHHVSSGFSWFDEHVKL